jgi:hypothetical protein
MLFQNNRQIQAQSTSQNTMNMIVMQPLNRNRFRQVAPKVSPDIHVQIPEQRQKTMLWGEPTWYLFHTLAEKVKHDSFPKIRKELLSFIYRICNNLPCPDCANHASRYMQGVNFDAIQTTDDLKQMLWRFHNVVNQRKKYELFQLKDLDGLYHRANTEKIIRNFLLHYEKRGYGMRLGTDGFHRTRMANEFKIWLHSNIHHFRA